MAALMVSVVSFGTRHGSRKNASRRILTGLLTTRFVERREKFYLNSLSVHSLSALGVVVESMKMSETSWGIGGVWLCCIDALRDIPPWYSVIPGDTVTCPSCKEVWTLGEDGLWSTAIQRGEG